MVTMTTAISDAIPAMASAPSPLMVFSPNWMTRKTVTVMAIAAPTPSHTHLSASRRSDFTRNATRIDTTMAASRPSRKPIRPLPNTCDVTLDAASVLVGTSEMTVIKASSFDRGENTIKDIALPCHSKAWLTLAGGPVSPPDFTCRSSGTGPSLDAAAAAHATMANQTERG